MCSLQHSTEKSRTVEGRTVETASAVYHFVINGISNPDDTDDDATKISKRKRKNIRNSKEQTSKIIRLKIVSKEAARVSKFMKPYLENSKSLCELQIIPLDIPHR